MLVTTQIELVQEAMNKHAMGWNEKEWKEGKNIHCLRLTITHFTINKIKTDTV